MSKAYVRRGEGRGEGEERGGRGEGEGRERGRRGDGEGTERGRRGDGEGTERGRRGDGEGTERGRRGDGEGREKEGRDRVFTSGVDAIPAPRIRISVHLPSDSEVQSGEVQTRKCFDNSDEYVVVLTGDDFIESRTYTKKRDTERIDEY